MHVLKFALRPWRISPMTHIAMVTAISVVMIVGGSVLWLIGVADPAIQRVQNEQIITAYLSPDVPETKISEISDSIHVSLGAAGIQEVDVEFVGVQGFLDRVRQEQPAFAEELLQLGGEMERVVPRYMSISGLLPETTTSLLEGVVGIEKVSSSHHRLSQISEAFAAVRGIGFGVVIALAIALIACLTYIGRTQFQLQTESLSVLRLFGGSEILVRSPVFCSVLLAGLLGGCFAAATWLLAHTSLLEQIKGISPVFGGVQDVYSILTVVLLFVSSGALIGGLSGTFAVLFTRIKNEVRSL